MGAAVILLVFLVGPNVYVNAEAEPSRCYFSNMFEKFVHQIVEFAGRKVELIQSKVEKVKLATSIDTQVYVPKYPRRPIIMVWPSVMNPQVTQVIQNNIQLREQKGAYTRIKCYKGSISPIVLREVEMANNKTNNEYGWPSPYDEVARANVFFKDLVPKLILWLSAEALECGFFTIFKNELPQIVRFIQANRLKWVIALEELLYILLQVIAVVHNVTNPFDSITYPSMNWMEEWPEAYESWSNKHVEPLEYLQKFILNSFDIVIAWLFDYLSQRARGEPTLMNKPFWNHADTTEWNLSNDGALICALDYFDKVPGHNNFGWEYLLDKVGDKMTVMKNMFMECNNIPQGDEMLGCIYSTTNNLIPVEVGKSGGKNHIVMEPPETCTFKCKTLPNALNFKPHRTIPNPLSTYTNIAYGHAYMATEAGHNVYCDVKRTALFANAIRTHCFPLITMKYLSERYNKLCKSANCAMECCEKKICEIVKDMPMELPNKTVVVLFRKNETFTDIEKL